MKVELTLWKISFPDLGGYVVNQKSKKSNVIPFPRSRTRKGSAASTQNNTAEQPSPENDLKASEVNFKIFAQAIISRNLDIAAKALAVIMNISESSAKQATAHFTHKLSSDSNFMSKAIELRTHVESNNINEALMLMYECFSLQGPEALGALQHLSQRLD